MKNYVLLFFHLYFCAINLIFAAENNQNSDLTLDKLSTRIDKASNKIDNEFCAVWEVLNEYQREIDKQKQTNNKQNILIADLSRRLAVLEAHTHGYYLSNTYGGLGNNTQTTKPLQVKTEIPKQKPYQIQAQQTTKPVVKDH